MVHLLLAAALVVAGPLDEKPGHSKHGSAFDSGMRTKPWRIEGVGKSPFPIATKNPEVQVWYDQGNALLHSFWFEEAERSFRWCLKLDPENPMVYWSLARVGLNWFFDESSAKRYREFLAEAVKRKDRATERERMYIEAWDAGFKVGVSDRFKIMVDKLDAIVQKYPDDIEAKALKALFGIGIVDGVKNELLIQQVLRANPDHPGAHHYRIHNWDYQEPAKAIRSCEEYGGSAPAIGHARHMPGHIYSKIGMWHEAAQAMDAATRIELRYMTDRLALPFETWNYAHNRNYLCYIQEQLGMPAAALAGARDLIESPRDPQLNEEEGYAALGQGMAALVRGLLKFERFDEIVKSGNIPWRNTERDKQVRAMAESVAFAALGKPEESQKRIHDLRASLGKTPNEFETFGLLVAEGLAAHYKGDLQNAISLLQKAADLEKKWREGQFAGDPPDEPWLANRLLGDTLMAAGKPREAVAAYELGLKFEPNDAFPIAGLAMAHFKLGEREKAREYAGRLEYVWSSADRGLRWLKEVRALKLDADPIGVTPAKERPYRPSELDKLGPSNWQPFSAPGLTCKDVDGKTVKLSDYRGKNVILIFYLNDACVHCVEQLVSINKRMAEFDAQDAVVLAVSSASPKKNRESVALAPLGFTLLSDSNHEGARRFSSYDDFEEMELHSTILIDRKGKLRWKRTGGDPFTDISFLLRELRRVNGR